MKIVTIGLLCFITLAASADKYLTKTAKISFYASGGSEKIEADNRAVGVLLDSKTGALRFLLLIKSFVFDKKLMQEHFNENYLESGKYPKASFDGQVIDFDKINMAKDGKYNVKVSGKLTIHGVTKSVSEAGVLLVQNGQPNLTSAFSITLEDYKIKIPGVVKDKIAKDVKIEIDANLKKM